MNDTDGLSIDLKCIHFLFLFIFWFLYSSRIINQLIWLVFERSHNTTSVKRWKFHGPVMFMYQNQPTAVPIADRSILIDYPNKQGIHSTLEPV